MGKPGLLFIYLFFREGDMVVQVAELARSVAVWPAKRSPMGLMVGRSWLVEGLGGG